MRRFQSDSQQQQWDEQGQFIVRGLLARDTAMKIRGVAKNMILAQADDDLARRCPTSEYYGHNIAPSMTMWHQGEAKTVKVGPGKISAPI